MDECGQKPLGRRQLQRSEKESIHANNLALKGCVRLAGAGGWC